jgi:hypothetical protein
MADDLKREWARLEAIAAPIRKSLTEEQVKELRLCGMCRDRVKKALTISAATETSEGAEIAHRILKMERQRAARAQLSPVLKALEADVQKSVDLIDQMLSEATTAIDEDIDAALWEHVDNDEWPCYGTCYKKRGE